jgi:hypothetical protein
MKHLNLISGPRNISTALMYSFAQRADTMVLDEPFYACYLAQSQADHPGRDEVLQAQPVEEKEVLASIFQSWSVPVLFIKNMAHHIEVLGKDFLSRVTNVFLIRNPRQIIASYAQVIQQPVMRDIGIEYQCNLFFDLVAQGQKPVVIDSALLLENPEKVLRRVCDAVDLDFDAKMLHWEPGPKPYDGVWAKYWYSNVHNSTGFAKQPTSERSLPPQLSELHEKARHYYEKLLPFCVKP